MTVCGTPWIMAPELLQSKPYGSPADVFSYGIVLCEIVIRCKTDDIPRTNDFGVDINEVKKLNTNKFSEKFLNLIEQCTQLEPTQRPSFEKIIPMFDEIYQEYTHLQ